MRRRTRRSRGLGNPGRTCLLLAMLAACAPACADNPGYDRPGIGFTPAVLDAGEVTWEQGLPDWSLDRQDGQRIRQYSADTLLRVGLGGPFELQLAGSPYNELVTGPQRREGHGDSSLGIKVAPHANGVLSWGLLASAEFNDGAAALRNAQRRYLLGAQFNLALGPRQSLGGYLEQVVAPGGSQSTLALNDSIALRDDLAAYVEAAWQHLPARGDGTLLGAGLAWQANRRVQLDAGLDRRLSGAALRWQANLGVSVFFGR